MEIDLYSLAATLAVVANMGMFVVLFARMVVLIQYFRMGYYTKVQEGLALLQIIAISAVLVTELYTIQKIV